MSFALKLGAIQNEILMQIGCATLRVPIFFLLLMSCNRISQPLTYTYPISQQDISLRLNGYYSFDTIAYRYYKTQADSSSKYAKHHVMYSFILYGDGTCYFKLGGTTGAIIENEEKGLDSSKMNLVYEKYEQGLRRFSEDGEHTSTAKTMDWGTYKVIGDSIYIETYDREWYAIGWSSNKFAPVHKFKGIIINDSTFEITYFERRDLGNAEIGSYNFHSYCCKPDSIWKFNKKIGK
jgi:hypothetical protein